MKKEIMLFISTLAGGGAEKALINLLKMPGSEKYNFTVITLASGDRIGEIPEGVKLHRAVSFKSRLLNNFFIRLLHHIPYSIAARICIRGRYDTEIAYLEGFPTRIIAARKTKARKIAFVHGTFTKDNEALSLYVSEKQCYDIYCGFDKVCFVSEDTKLAMENYLGKLENSCVIHNIFDISEIEQGGKMPCEAKYKTDGMKLIAVGSYTKVKGFDRLIRAVKRLEEDFDFELWILGKGALKAEYERMIRSEKIRSIRLLDFDKNPYKYMAQSDLLVCSSFSEGYSTVAVEALILGIPVLSVDCSGMAEILDGGRYGLIVDNNEDALTEGLRKILLQKDVYENIKGNALLFKDNFSNDDAFTEYMKIFD